MACGIYKFENKINHKIYIGLTIDLEERYNKHFKNINDLSKQTYFYHALRKYGWNNFDYQVLESFKEYDKEQLSLLEDYYVQKYDCLMPKGYNMVPGGYNGAGLAKGKSVEQYDLNGNFIAEYNSAHEAERQTGISFSDICRCCRDNNNTYYSHNYQWKYKDSNRVITSVKKNTHLNDKIYQFSSEGTLLNIYDNLKMANEQTGISKSAISQACSHPTWKANGYHWSYDKNYKVPATKRTNISKQKKVQQFDKNNNLLATYNSIAEASKQTQVNGSNISLVCQGKRKTAGKYIWKYV